MSFDRVRWIELPKVADKRGNLSFIESARHIPFEIARTYWLYDVPGDEHRNGHAFKEQGGVYRGLVGQLRYRVE